jgi:hypothetical protein
MSERMGGIWLRYARLLSSIQFASTEELAQRGHPYAQRHFRLRKHAARGGLPAPSYYINPQSGRLLEHWAMQVTAPSAANNIFIRLTNPTPYFRWLVTGTGRMIRRPILSVSLSMARREFGEIYTDAERRIHGYR